MQLKKKKTSAINFLLLAHKHKRKDFNEMCCINLSHHSKSIHKGIQQLKKSVTKIKIANKT